MDSVFFVLKLLLDGFCSHLSEGVVSQVQKWPPASQLHRLVRPSQHGILNKRAMAH